MANPLSDTNFLLELDKTQNREVYAKVTLLDFDEMPKADFSGRVTQGSVNLDGNSAIRRTCSLTIAAELSKTDSYMWSLNSKFKLEIGLKNTVLNSEYKDIIWFPMGIYFITSFNLNRNTTTTNISISGKDKMALLAGDLGGVVPSLTWDFGSIEVTDKKGNVTVEKYLIKNIIRELVHEFAKEPFQNIIINDLEDNGLELLQYNYSKPMYLLHDIDADIISQFTLKDKQGPYYKVEWVPPTEQEPGHWEATDILVTFANENFNFEILNNAIPSPDPTYFTTQEYKNKSYIRRFACIKAVQGDTIGYRTTELVYAGDLIASVGESVISVLDKIKNMLGDYEYFYNLEGQFVFQRKRVSLQHPWNQLSTQNPDSDEQYVDLYKDEYAYNFNEGIGITTLSNTPNISNVKNDFTVWGTKKGSSNTQIPIHCRYAIQTKPKFYRTVGEANGYNSKGEKQYKNQVTYVTTDYTGIATNYEVVDWREIIYRMALDYRKHMHDAATPDAEFYSLNELMPQIAKNNKVHKNNDPDGEVVEDYYPSGYTGYEQYYTDMEGFWRLLYDPDYVGTFYPISDLTKEEYNEKQIGEIYYFKKQAGNPYQKNYKYYKLKKNTTDQYEYVGKITKEEFEKNSDGLYKAADPIATQKSYNAKLTYYTWDHDEYYTDDNAPGSSDAERLRFRYWNKNVFSNPEGLIFWFDFVDAETNSELSMYAVDNIGLRSLAKNDSAVKAVVYKEVPNVLFVENPTGEELEYIKENNTGYTVLPLSENLKDIFKTSVQGKSAKDEIDTQIYNKACCCESITINCVPIYHIEPNSRIYVKDTKAGINGDYLAERMSINLAYNGMMNITATKIIDRII